MNKTYNHREAVREAVKRGIDPFFIDRLDDMIWHVVWSNQGNSRVKDLFVSKGWPSRGSVRFTRVDDGVRFKAILKGNKFKVIMT